MTPTFTAHNIRLADGSLTKPDGDFVMDQHPWFRSARRTLDTVFPGDKRGLRIADLGCLEGGYAVEFARLGFDSLGLEVRDSNFAACQYVRERVALPNLSFVQDDAWNIERHGPFDAMFCCGLLYHLDRPHEFIRTLSRCTRKLLILHTHFATEADNPNYNLSPLTEHEGLPGRWYAEFNTDEAFADRDAARWSSWDNRQSFWIQRQYLMQAMYNAGFDMVLEQVDSMGPHIGDFMTKSDYRTHERGMFVGVKTGL